MTASEARRDLPTISVTPATGLIDEPLHIVARRLPPGAAMTIRARLLDPNDVLWSSHATYTANGDGLVDLTSQAPVSGTYRGVDGDGLISSLAPDDRVSPRTFDASSVAPLLVDFTADLGGQHIASAHVRRLYITDGVRMTSVREHSLSGLFFEPGTDGPRPGIIVVGGSSGKLLFAAQVAALLAGHGYPSLALAYFGLDDLPPHLTEIPIAYFSRAIDWLSSQSTVRPDALGVIGRSRGAELALLLGSRLPCIRAVVAYCPSGIVWNGLGDDVPTELPAWCDASGPIPFLSLMSPELSEVRTRVFQNGPVALSPLFDAALDLPIPPDTVIPVEKTNGPILLISGEEDQMWPSTRMGDQIMRRLEAQAHPFASRHCRYPGAGHLMRPPGVSTSVLQNKFAFGGHAPMQAAANRAAWAETLSFLHATLDVRSWSDVPDVMGAVR